MITTTRIVVAEMTSIGAIDRSDDCYVDDNDDPDNSK